MDNKEVKVEIKKEVDCDEILEDIKTETNALVGDDVSGIFEFKNDGSIMTVKIPGEQQMYIPIVLQNCVTYMNVHTHLNLITLNASINGAEYNPKIFKAVTVRVIEPRATIRIFESGKIMSFGAKTEYDSILSMKKFIRLLQKLGYDVPLEFIKIKVCNLVATCDVESSINFDHLTEISRNCSSYEPEIFPGMIYKIDVPKITLLIFENGKITLVGAKRREDIKIAVENIYPILKKCFKYTNVSTDNNV